MRYLKNTFRGAPGERIPHDLLNTLANFWNDLRVIGGKLQRCSDGRNTTIEITSTVATDTDGYALTKNPDGRQSIQHNPEDYTDDTDSHAQELQLHNVHAVKAGSGSIPVFFSETPLQGHVPDKVVGELYWATPDADRLADNAELVFRSLDVADTHATSNKGRFQLSLYGFTGASISQVPYAKEVTNPKGSGRELEWRWPVRCFVGAAQDPCNTVAVQNKVMTRVAPGTATGSYATMSFWSRNLTVSKGALEIEVEDTYPFPVYLPLTIDPKDITVDPSTIPHTDLDFSSSTEGAAGTNADHDQQYLQRDGAYNAAKTHTNICDSIAHDSAGAYGIEFSTGKLLDGNHGEAVYYGARTLLKTTAERAVDWENGVLGETTAWYCSRAFIGGRDPRYGGTTFYSAHTFYSKPFEIEAESTNAGGLLCKSQPYAGYNYFGFNESGVTDVARFGTQGGQERVKIMSVASAVDRTLVLQAVDGTVQMIADGTNKTVTLTNLRLDAGGGNWIGFTATNGQLIIVDQSGNQLGLLAKEEPA